MDLKCFDISCALDVTSFRQDNRFKIVKLLFNRDIGTENVNVKLLFNRDNDTEIRPTRTCSMGWE